MQGIKRFESKLLYEVNLDGLVSEEHFLVKLDRAISFDWVRERTRSYYSHTGKPSIDPVVLVKMLLIGYLYGITSERRLADEIHYNLAYRWYVGYDLDEEVPNHSVLSKARARFGRELFVEIFEEILKECVSAGLVSGKGFLVDSTLIDADASLDSLVDITVPVEAYWCNLEDSSSPATGEQPPGDEPGQEGDNKGDKKKRSCDKKEPINTRKVSRTDPDATIHTRPGKGTSLGYKAHFAADSDEGIVTAVAVSPNAYHDGSRLPELIWSHSKRCGLPGAAAGDSHYGTDESLGFLESHGIKAATPPTGDRKSVTKLQRRDFLYDEEQDLFVCPRGNILKRRRKNHKSGRVEYLACARDCGPCDLRSRCLQRNAEFRIVTRTESEERDRAREFSTSDEGRKLLLRRKTVMEGLFGRAKNQHGMSRAHFRGIENVEIQVLLTAAAMNLKKLAKRTEKNAYPGLPIGNPSTCHFLRRFIKLLIKSVLFVLAKPGQASLATAPKCCISCNRSLGQQ